LISDTAVLLESLVWVVGDDEVGNVEAISTTIKFQAANTFVSKLPQISSGLQMVQRLLHGSGPSQNL
jgi:hypothetical protein